MTVIASCCVEGVFVVVGDLLLSRAAEAGNPLQHLPSQVEHFPGTSEHTPAGLDHKVVLIGEKCAIAWTGYRDSAKKIIKEIRDIYEAGKLTPFTLSECIENHPDFQLNWISIVGWMAWDGQMLRIDHGNTRYRDELKRFGYAVAAGSGTSTLLDVMTEIDGANIEGLVPFSPALALEHPVDGNRALTVMLSVIAMLMTRETIEGGNSDSLQKAFGAGYEIAYFNMDRFVMLEDFALHVWHSILIPDGELQAHPVASFHQGYVNGWLLIECEYFQAQRFADFILGPPFATDRPT